VGGNPQDLVSWVIYLKNHSNVPRSPFQKGLPNGEEVVRFHYRSIELGKQPHPRATARVRPYYTR
ncbi:MAG: hypothetical protein ACXVB7_19950, partial [Ktedonobacteraceae bacterium]